MILFSPSNKYYNTLQLKLIENCSYYMYSNRSKTLLINSVSINTCRETIDDTVQLLQYTVIDTLLISCATPITSFLPFNIGMHSIDLIGTRSSQPSSLSTLGCRFNEAAQTCTSAMFNNYAHVNGYRYYNIFSSQHIYTPLQRYTLEMFLVEPIQIIE